MKVIPYGHHWLDEEEIAEVVRVLRSEWITQGPSIHEFEERVAAYCGARYGVAFSSGTAALHAACFASGIGPGDEVITTPLTFVATANAVVYQGGVPVFADIDPQTLNIDPGAIVQRITGKTKAILPVHFGGLPCQMGRIYEIARNRGLKVIEDACHALGAEWVSSEGRREKVGSCSHSDMAVFSFHPVKHITTGEGGMVLTNKEDLWEKLRIFRHHGIMKTDGRDSGVDEPWHYEMHCLGHNYRITDFQCALGLKQLEKLDRFLLRRREIATTYRQAFEDIELTPQRENSEEERHAWHLFVVQLALEALQTDRRTIFRALRKEGIGVNVHYLPVHLHPFYRNRFSYRPGDYPIAEDYYERALTLPLFPRMKNEDVHEVVRAVRRVLGEYRRSAASGALAPSKSGG